MSELNMYKERQQQSIHVEEQKTQLKNNRAITSLPGDDMGAAPAIQKERDALKLIEQEAVELTEENIGDVHFSSQVQEDIKKDPILAKAESKSINMVSSMGSQNLHRIQNGIEPKLNTKYVD